MQSIKILHKEIFPKSVVVYRFSYEGKEYGSIINKEEHDKLSDIDKYLKESTQDHLKNKK